MAWHHPNFTLLRAMFPIYPSLNLHELLKILNKGWEVSTTLAESTWYTDPGCQTVLDDVLAIKLNIDFLLCLILPTISHLINQQMILWRRKQSKYVRKRTTYTENWSIQLVSKLQVKPIPMICRTWDNEVKYKFHYYINKYAIFIMCIFEQSIHKLFI